MREVRGQGQGAAREGSAGMMRRSAFPSDNHFVRFGALNPELPDISRVTAHRAFDGQSCGGPSLAAPDNPQNPTPENFQNDTPRDARDELRGFAALLHGSAPPREGSGCENGNRRVD